MPQQTTNVNCPKCLKDRGHVRGVIVQADSQTLTYICDNCKHSWTGEHQQSSTGSLFHSNKSEQHSDR